MKPVVAIPLVIVLIAGAVLIYIQSRRAMNPPAEGRPVRCAACDHEFVPPKGTKDVICPECGSDEIVVLWWYKCRECGEQFVGVEERLKDGAFRFPGGEWKGANEFTKPTCPECSSQRVSNIRVPDDSGD